MSKENGTKDRKYSDPISILILLLACFVTSIVLFSALQFFGLTGAEDNDASQIQTRELSNFEDCAEAGGAVMESYPPRCITPDGTVFTQGTE